MPKKRPYDQFCPIARALDTVGDRWTLLIVRELFVGPIRYGELLEALAPISTDVLAKRLKEMEGSGLLEHSPDGSYDLGGDGAALAPVLGALAGWGIGHLSPPTGPEQLTGSRALQMLVLGNRDPSATERTVGLDVDGVRYSLSSTPSGYRARRGARLVADAEVTTDGPTLWAVGSGTTTWSDATACGAVVVEGDAAVAESLLAGRLPVTTIDTDGELAATT